MSDTKPAPTQNDESHCPPPVRPAHDASDDPRLQRNPSDDDAKLDVAGDETFPASDPAANIQPHKGKDPPPSSGYDEEAEKARMAGKE